MQDLDVKKIKNASIFCVFTAKDWCLHDSANVISGELVPPRRSPKLQHLNKTVPTLLQIFVYLACNVGALEVIVPLRLRRYTLYNRTLVVKKLQHLIIWK